MPTLPTLRARSARLNALAACALMLLLATSIARPEEVAIPATPAGHVLAAWLDAYNSGDPQK